jgi:hypothetical protein
MTRPALRMLRFSNLALIFVLCLLVLATLGAHGTMFFYLNEGVRKCFLEEVPKDTLVLVRFKSAKLGQATPPPEAPKEEDQVGIKLTVHDPADSIVYQRNLPLEGRYAFTAQAGGEHKICLQTSTSRWFGQGFQLQIELDIETGVGATDYDEIARLESLSAMELEVRRLNDAVHEIIAEQIYQKKRETAFRNTSESTNSIVMWWSIGQTVLLLASAFWQIRHLKNFFHQKKVV